MSSSVKKPPASARDAEATKSRILDAAEEEFARAGLLGARTEAIAANTGVTKAMIHYYFRDKEGLYVEVLTRCIADRVRAFHKVDLNNPDCNKALSDFARVFLQSKAKDKNVASIFLYEALQNKGKYYGKVAVAALYEPLVELLRRGTECGQFRQLDPLHAAVNIVGLCVFYYCSEENVKHLWRGTDLRSPAMRDTHAAEALQMVMASVQPNGSQQ